MAVSLDNVKSMVSRDRGETDLVSSQCVFAQAYRQLRDTEAKVLRTVWDGERVFQVRLKVQFLGLLPGLTVHVAICLLLASATVF